jgi:hypothetical protein
MLRLAGNIFATIILLGATLAAVAAFLAAAAGLGYATHRVFPAVDVGAGTIAAAVALAALVSVSTRPHKMATTPGRKAARRREGNPRTVPFQESETPKTSWKQ